MVKNEADVLQESLLAALNWCDHIYVFDNGSDDGSWELVKALAEEYPGIVPYKQDDTCFSDGLRADIFNEFRSQCRPGDWWCRLDADEFYIDDPRVFLAKIPDQYGMVWSASFSYYFTDQDAENYRQDPARFLATPVQQRLRFYINHWSEPRFFRHGENLVWTRGHGGWPKDFQRPYPVRIWVKHYAYRSPGQIGQRLRSRRAAIQAGTFGHETVKDWGNAVASVRETRAGFDHPDPALAGEHWEERIVPASRLDFDGGDRRYVVNEHLMPKVPKPKYQKIVEYIDTRLRPKRVA